MDYFCRRWFGRSWLLSGVCVALLVTACTGVRAELPAARLTSVFPPGAKQGTTVQVTLAGQDLDELTGLRFSDGRISAKAGSTPNTFAVTVAADAPPGIYDVRAVGRYGISNPRAFVVGTLAEAVNKPGNVGVSAATAIAVGQTISAVAEANTVQHYRLSLKKGQRVFAEVEAGEIDSRLTPNVILADASGRDRVIQRRGELVDFTAPADGEYVIKVHDVTYRGGPEFFYRLSVHSGPHVDFVLPPAGLPGTRGRYQLFGRNLPGGTPSACAIPGGAALEQLAVDIRIPRDADRSAEGFSHLASPAALLDGFDYRLTTPGGTSNPVRVSFATAPPVARVEAQDVQPVTVPCEVFGKFRPRGGADVFTFDAAANSGFWIEVFSNRLGHPTSPFLLVQRVGKDDKGNAKLETVQEVYESPTNIGGPEFKTASRDPVYRLETKAAGTYRVSVRNLFTTDVEEAARVYRMAIRTPSPDFRLAAFPANPVAEKDSKDVPITTPLLRRGGITPIRVVAQRVDGFAGEIQLAVEGLPPGVTCAPASIPAGGTSATLLLTAAENAEPVVAPLKVTGTTIVGGTTVTRTARPGTVATSNYVAADKVIDVTSRRSRGLFVAVLPEPSPMSIVPKVAVLETCVFNKVRVELHLLRRGEVVGPVPLKLTGHPLLAPLKEVAIAAGANDGAIDLDLSQVKLPAGTYDLYAESLAKVKYVAGKAPAKEVPASFYSTPLRLVVTSAPITLSAPAPVAVEAGSKVEVPVRVTRMYGYGDPIELALVAPSVKGVGGKATVPKDQSEAKLLVQTDAATPPGDHTIKLEAKLKLSTQTITVEQPVTLKVTAKPQAK